MVLQVLTPQHKLISMTRDEAKCTYTKRSLFSREASILQQKLESNFKTD